MNRSRFWNLVFRFDEPPEIPLIGKIIGPTEAVELVERIQDLKALLVRVAEESQRGTDNRHGRDAVRQFIGALMARGSSSDQLAIFESLTTEERGRIEQSILTIPPYVDADGRTDYRTRDRLLGSLPFHLIVTPEVADIRRSLDAAGGPPPNVPLFEIGKADWLEFKTCARL